MRLGERGHGAARQLVDQPADECRRHFRIEVQAVEIVPQLLMDLVQKLEPLGPRFGREEIGPALDQLLRQLMPDSIDINRRQRTLSRRLHHSWFLRGRSLSPQLFRPGRPPPFGSHPASMPRSNVSHTWSTLSKL